MEQRLFLRSAASRLCSMGRMMLPPLPLSLLLTARGSALVPRSLGSGLAEGCLVWICRLRNLLLRSSRLHLFTMSPHCS
ncbi:hypothetical protein CLIM01_01722 [Colletotrichum limetticola]|uniref:Secreted protein n=1 Tax=Colletotrichum limetticola TaxID=1209924 RepID=A0ABQ9QBD5_9PEZI|nr:hypothetical protein CLIM01_01722 [Colletotrichum limetticola]